MHQKFRTLLHVTGCGVAALIGLTACSGEDPIACGVVSTCPFGVHAAATAACGPTDGPAVTIYLADEPITSADPTAPYTRVTIWQGIDELGPGTFNVTGDDPGANAWHHPDSSHIEFATGGTIRIDDVSATRTVEGHADLVFPGPMQVRADFEADWIAGNPMCG